MNNDMERDQSQHKTDATMQSNSKSNDVSTNLTPCPNKCPNNPSYASSNVRFCEECYNECMLAHQPRIVTRSLTLIPSNSPVSRLSSLTCHFDAPFSHAVPRRLDYIAPQDYISPQDYIAPQDYFAPQDFIPRRLDLARTTDLAPLFPRGKSTGDLEVVGRAVSVRSASIEQSADISDASNPSIATANPLSSSPIKQTNSPHKQHCHACNHRLGLVDLTCKCGHRYCSAHRLAEQHNCQYDYKSEGRSRIAQENPPVRPTKIARLG